jgi:hypothetical protein
MRFKKSTRDHKMLDLIRVNKTIFKGFGDNLCGVFVRLE